jgi:hypothetical protein
MSSTCLWMRLHRSENLTVVDAGMISYVWLLSNLEAEYSDRAALFLFATFEETSCYCCNLVLSDVRYLESETNDLRSSILLASE